MKIRTQLILICFLLAVVPLSSIVAYSYYASRRALETAYHSEASRMTAQMDRRLGIIRSDLEQRLAEVSALPTLSESKTSEPDMRNVLLTLGDTASLVDSLEIQPVRPLLPEIKVFEKKVEPKPHAVAVTAAAASPAPAVAVPTPAVAPSAPPSPAPPPVPPEDIGEAISMAPVVIDLPPLPKMPHFVMTEEQRAQLAEIRRLGRELGTKWNEMTEEQRNANQKQLNDVQQQFNKSMQVTQAQFQKELNEALKAREEARRIRDEKRRADLEARKAAANAPPEPLPPLKPAPKVSVAPAVVTASAAPARESKPLLSGEPEIHRATPAESARLRAKERQVALVLGQKFNVPVRSKGTVVAQISAHVSTDEVIRRVLGATNEDRSEVAFAVDRDGNLYTRSDDDRRILEGLGVRERLKGNKPLNTIENWIVVLSRDPQSGLRVGVARPVGEGFVDLRNTAAKNFGYGMALVFVLMIGIVPIANHMTRDVKMVTLGAERIARGDLMTRLPVTSRNEFGQLANAFNVMAQDLSLHQQTIIEQERDRQEQSMQQRLLEAEYARKSDDLEEARRFQLSLLPKHVPQLPEYDIAVFTQTAAEVGGDYYDFHVNASGVLSAAIGDATGHGARAGTMVTVVKALFAGYAPEVAPSAFLRDAAEKVKRMDLGRMSMALLVARFEKRRVTLASAGMPPAYVHRKATGGVDEIALHATPLGTLAAAYHDATIELSPGDTLLLMTDGFPELLNAAGQQVGYVAAAQEFAKAAAASDANGVIAALSDAARRWNGDQPPNDDVTFVVVRALA